LVFVSNFSSNFRRQAIGCLALGIKNSQKRERLPLPFDFLLQKPNAAVPGVRRFVF